MPELPEVQTVVNTLRPMLVGRTILTASLLRRDILTPAGFDLPAALAGRTITNLSRRGKKIIFTLDVGQFYIHLGMTGRLTAASPNEPMLPHTHFVLNVAKTQIRFVDPRRFGGIFWLAPGEDPAGDLGPEPLNLRASQLARRLARTKRPIKSALLDQTLIAGIGNIYADEALFASRIHPLTPSHKLAQPQIARLTRSIKAILRKAIHHRGSSLRDYRDPNDQAGRFQTLHRVYHRTGHPCPTCQTPIAKLTLSGRSTHFCPKCQRLK